MPNRAGYTDIKSEAGLYTSLELDKCAGNGFDWLAERLTYNEVKEFIITKSCNEVKELSR
jgi:hypothetical protein